MKRSTFLCLALTAIVLAQGLGPDLKLPLQPKSVRFAVIGDSGTGEKQQYDVSEQMAKFRGLFPFDFVIMLGDNIYGGQGAEDYKSKFEIPYKPLLDLGVKFYAALGNHDDTNQRFYKPFNMRRQTLLQLQERQRRVLYAGQQLHGSRATGLAHKGTSKLKCRVEDLLFPSPLYTHAKYHGPDTDLRRLLEPVFQQSGVNVVYAGTNTFMRGSKPQTGIYYFVLGNSGPLRFHDLRPSKDTAKGFDTIEHFRW